MNLKNIIYKIYSKNLVKQIIKFFLVGLFSNLISFLTYIIMINFANISIFFSAISGQLLGIISNYFLNSRLVFMKKLNLKYKTFFLIYYLSAIYLVGKYIEIISIKIDYRISWFVCIVFVTIFNFLFLKLIAFKK